MNYKDKKKFTILDKRKIIARYNSKIEEYRLKSLDELQELYMKGGISSTDRQAIVVVTNQLLRERAAEIAKERDLETKNDEIDG